ncbi:MAG: type II toxin-antitoxin system VapC family toxin [Fimbriiglobus sp.]
MPDFFYDSSEINKHYHIEPGTARVDELLAVPGAEHLISRLSVVEVHSALAKKVRTGTFSASAFDLFSRRFRKDIQTKRLRVVRVTAAHFDAAERLIRRLGPVRNLRTLDALQLAVALDLNQPGRPVGFVCADQALATIATEEGLTVVNPEAG